MINSLFVNTCNILRRDDDSLDSWGNYKYIPLGIINCLFTSKAGYSIRTTEVDRIDIAGVILISADDVELLETDKIHLIDDDYIYGIAPSGIAHEQDFMTGAKTHYKINVIRRQKYDEEKIEITQSS